MERTKPLVIIVEDDPLSAQLAYNALKAECNVRVKLGVQDAIDECTMQQPDILFLDIHLPDGDGRHVLNYMREHHSHIDVVMLSGDRNTATILEALKMGAKGFVTKPFRKNSLQHYVRTHT